MLYVLVSGVMVGLVPYQQLGVPAPMARRRRRRASQGARDRRGRRCSTLMPLVVKLGAITGLSSTIIVQMMAQPRIFMAMAQDGLLPAWAATHSPALPHAARHDAHHRRRS